VPETLPVCGTVARLPRPSLSITFDNLGEAAEVEMGWWGDRALGTHKTAPFVAKLIEALGDVKATYFIEASNAEVYPEVIKAWASAGHEVGLHAWRHESWGRCPTDRRRELLERSMRAMLSIGITPVGFRPPGGVVPDDAWVQFQDVGLSYCSGLGEPGIFEIKDMLSFPFAWRNVDAYVLEEVMKEVRVACGDPLIAPGLDVWRPAVIALSSFIQSFSSTPMKSSQS